MFSVFNASAVDKSAYAKKIDKVRMGHMRRHLQCQDETSVIIPKTPEQQLAQRHEEQGHIARAMLLGFAAAGLASWNQFLSKIAADLFFESLLVAATLRSETMVCVWAGYSGSLVALSWIV